MFQQSVVQSPGTGTFTTHTFEILLMLAGAFLFGLWFGWILWSRYKQTAEKLRLDNDSLNASLAALRSEIDSLKTKVSELETERASTSGQAQNLSWENDTYRSQIAILESDLEKARERNRRLETEMALSQSGETGSVSLEATAPLSSETSDELPDLEETIANAIDETFDKANLDLPELEDALTEAVTTAVTNQQAETQAPELPELPPETGVEDVTLVSPVTTIVAPTAEPDPKPIVVAVHSGPRDDLKIVEGIGPKIEELLFNAGITTYGQLAATSVQQLKDLLGDAGSRFAMHDPGTWSAQALLAANGEWENLKAYQDFLNAGKRPDK